MHQGSKFQSVHGAIFILVTLGRGRWMRVIHVMHGLETTLLAVCVNNCNVMLKIIVCKSTDNAKICDVGSEECCICSCY